MRILGISGSLRRGSHNTRLLHATRGVLPEGAELDVYDGLGAIPPYNEDDEHEAPVAARHCSSGCGAGAPLQY